jgi:hypothetical protein
MADISKITTLDGTTYNIKDSTARASIPSSSTAAPLMDNTAAVGTSAKYAREDHVHPKDTSKVSTASTSSGSNGYINYTSGYKHRLTSLYDDNDVFP